MVTQLSYGRKKILTTFLCPFFSLAGWFCLHHLPPSLKMVLTTTKQNRDCLHSIFLQISTVWSHPMNFEMKGYSYWLFFQQLKFLFFLQKKFRRVFLNIQVAGYSLLFLLLFKLDCSHWMLCVVFPFRIIYLVFFLWPNIWAKFD